MQSFRSRVSKKHACILPIMHVLEICHLTLIVFSDLSIFCAGSVVRRMAFCAISAAISFPETPSSPEISINSTTFGQPFMASLLLNRFYDVIQCEIITLIAWAIDVYTYFPFFVFCVLSNLSSFIKR